MKLQALRFFGFFCGAMLLLQLVPEQACALGRFGGHDLARLWGEAIHILRRPPMPVTIGAYIAGGLCLVYGFRIYQFVVMLPGFLLGGLAGFVLGAMQWGEIAGVLVALVGACFGAGLAWGLHQLAIFILGAVGGGIIVIAVSETVWNTTPDELIILIGALLGGGLLLYLAKAFIIVKSSFIGALLIAYGAGQLVNPIIWIALTLLGIGIQFGVARVFRLKIGSEDEGTSVVAKKEVTPPPLQKADPARLPVPAWNLAVFQDGSHIATYQLDTGIYCLGRDDEAHFRVEDDAVSRRHLEITVSEQGEVQLQDLGSANGTWKLGQQLITEDTPECGTWYQMGRAQVVFQRG
ncbi:MAG: DUF4203 domain-containing protein [Syntrophotaleaceae bacterium]